MKTGTVLLSGVTGFMGSHLAEELLLNNIKVVALVRNQSDLSVCDGFKNKDIIFVNIDSSDFSAEISKFNPDCLIHSAWQGVSVEGRNDWEIQVENIRLTMRLLILANELKLKKVIALGSQAEYGNINGKIKENDPCNPVNAYGSCKLATLEVLKSFCNLHSINWFWLRLFSLYGPRQNSNWLIPSVINNTYHNKPIDLTGCEQRYDYMYIKDFCRAVLKVLKSDAESGIFNLSSNSSLLLREMVEKIKNLVNPNAILNFGRLPYRPNQPMHIEGDSTKFNEKFHFKTEWDLEKSLVEIVSYYKNKELFLQGIK